MSITALVRRPGPRLAEGLVSHLERQAVEVEPADDCPDAVFVEDPVVVYGRTAVLARSGAPDRRTETAGVERALSRYEIRQLAAHLPDATVVPVPVTKVLHLKSAVTALPDGTVIVLPMAASVAAAGARSRPSFTPPGRRPAHAVPARWWPAARTSGTAWGRRTRSSR